jgi:PAS domain S-box-containing protein
MPLRSCSEQTSGANHTKQHPIRPSFVFFKNKVKYQLFISIGTGIFTLAANLFLAWILGQSSLKTPFALLGLVFPLLISLAWGPWFGLLTLAASCWTGLFWLWPEQGWGIFYSLFSYGLWIAYHGWLESRRKSNKKRFWLNVHLLAEIPFRFAALVGTYTLFSWLISSKGAPWGEPAAAPYSLNYIHIQALTDTVGSFMLIILAYLMSCLKAVRKLLNLPPLPAGKQINTIHAASLLAGISIWLLDALLDYLFFYPDSLWELTIGQVPEHEVYIRVLILTFFTIFGIILAQYTQKQFFLTKKIDQQFRIATAKSRIRKVIIENKDRRKLLNKACQELVDSQGFSNAWIGLFAKNQTLDSWFHAGFRNLFSPMEEMLLQGDLPSCALNCLEYDRIRIIEDLSSQCPDCPLKDHHENQAGFTMRMQHAGKIYGWISASLEKSFANDLQIQELFTELVKILSFALWSIDTEAERLLIEEKYTSVLSTTSDAVIAVSKEGIINHFNPGAENLFACPRENALGKKISNFLPPDCHEQLFDMQAQVLANGYVKSFETEIITCSAQRAPVEVALSLSNPDPEEEVTINAILRDITERKAATTTLLTSEKKFRDYLEYAPYGVLVVDDKGNYLDANPKALKITGYDKTELLSKKVTDLMPKEEIGSVFDHIQRTREQGKAQGEYSFITKSGEKRFMTVEAVKLPSDNYLGFAIDTTERKKTEKALRHTENKITSIFKSAPVGIGLVMDRVIQEANQTLCKITGYTKEELVGQSSRMLYPTAEEYQYAGKKNFRLIAKYGTGTLETKFVRKNGKIIDVLLSSTPLDPNNLKKGISFTALDITDRKKTLEDLKNNEELLESTQRLSKIGGWEWDVDKKTMTWTAETYRIHDLDPDQAPQDSADYMVKSLECYDPSNRDVIKKAFKDCINQGIPYDLESAFTTFKGRKLMVRTLGKPVLEKDQVVKVVGNLMDITEKSSMEEKYQTLFHKMLDGFALHEIILDQNGVPCDYRFLEINPAFENMTGLGREIIGKTVKEVLPDTEDHWIKTYGQVALTGAPISFGNYSAPLDKYFEVTAYSPQPNQFACIFTDATLRLRLTQAIEQINESIVITDTQGRIQYANPAFEKITGYLMAEVKDKDLFFLSNEKDPQSFYQPIFDTVLKGNMWQGRLVNRKKDGSPFIEDASIAPIQDTPGNIINLVAVKRDITSQLRMEEETNQLKDQYRQAQKMEAIGRLAGGVAHDMNNLLSPILGFSEILREDLDTSDKRRDSAETIFNAALRAKNLVRQLLSFSRKDTPGLKPLDLRKTIEGFQKLLGRTIREDIEITLRLAPNLPPIMGDSGQIEQVIMNMVINAQDAMPDGGSLTISTDRQFLDETYAATHQGVKPGEYVMLSISDTGMGMDKLTMEHLFEPFYSTKGSGGTGLGLATVYGIVKQHKGSIWVYSEPGQGSIFKIYLPVAKVKPLEEKKERPKKQDLAGSETILLVEDNQAVRDLALSLLKRHGYTVISAQNGVEALELLQDKKETIDLIVTDVVMSEMNGQELYSIVSKQYPNIKVIYMSGYTDNIITSDNGSEKDRHFIQKPFSVEDFARKIREVLKE